MNSPTAVRVLACVAIAIPATLISPRAQAANKDVLAFYFPWYYNDSCNEGTNCSNTFSKWSSGVTSGSLAWDRTCPSSTAIGAQRARTSDDVKLRYDICTNFWPVLGLYSSGSGCSVMGNLGRSPDLGSAKDTWDSLKVHMKWMQDYGISVMVVSFWGTPNNCDELPSKVLDNIFSYASTANWNIKVAIMRDKNCTTKERFLADMEWLYRKGYLSHNKYWKLDVGNGQGAQPVVFHYAIEGCLPDAEWAAAYKGLRGWVASNSTAANNWNVPLILTNAHSGYSELDPTRSMTARQSDGLFPYSTAWSPQTNYTQWVSSVHNKHVSYIYQGKGGPVQVTHRGIPVPTTMPGFDSCLHQPETCNSPGQPQICRDRGNYYIQTWTAARDAWRNCFPRPVNQMISITSFNDWTENNQIEPAVQRLASPNKPREYAGYVVDSSGTRNQWYYLILTRDQVTAFFDD